MNDGSCYRSLPDSLLKLIGHRAHDAAKKLDTHTLYSFKSLR